MIGRPRRRHAVDRSGRLRQSSQQTPKSASPEKAARVPREGKAIGWLKGIIIALGAAVVVFVIWAVAGTLITFNKVTDTNSTKRAPVLSFLGDIKPNQLQGEGDGRINVLLIGVGGAGHPGGTLADTIMVASIDPKNKEAALLSIPRDLWVPIAGNGYGKINSAHSYGEQHEKKTGGGPAVMKKTVGNILDLPIHYYVRVDFKALEKVVDALGGVTVDVERPIVDLSYPADNMIDYAPFRLAAGRQTLNGKTALKYVRSRHGANGEGSDFARAKRQQKLIDAVKVKALSVGVIGNPKKITELMNIVGNHIKTDISFTEMERFFDIWKSIDGSKMVTKVIDDSTGGPLVSHSGDGRGYILQTRTGDFSEVQQIAHEIFVDPYIRQEKATISLINATGSASLGQQIAKQLTSYGYTVTDNTPKGQKAQKAVELIDQTGTTPYTIKFLETRFKAEAVLRKNAGSATQIILTVGTDYKPNTLKSNAVTSPKASTNETAS